MTAVEWFWLMAGIAVFVVVPLGSALARRRHRRRAEDRIGLSHGAPRVLIRPVRIHPPGAGPVERWLAADGPAPTAGWWPNGGLVVDPLGAALLDAAGLRHALPTGTVAMVRRHTPRALLLLDAEDNPLARLPTGFADEDLRRLCDGAGWRFDPTPAWDRDTGQVLDLRHAVVDRAARDGGFAARIGAAVRRESR